MSSDPGREQEAKKWIETVLKRKLSGSLMEELKDGVVLCELANAIQPGTCSKYKPSGVAFVCRQNIEIYLNGCEKLGVPKTDRFESRDLFDGQRPKAVLDNIFSLSAASRNVSSFKGPYIGVKYADKNERNFSEEVLAKSKTAVPLWSQGDKEHKTENIDAYGIVKGKDMDKHSGGMSKWDQGGISHDTGSKHDSYGIVKVKGVDKHTGAQSKWEQGSLANDTASQHDTYGIVKVKGTDRHSGVQSKWEQGSLVNDTASQHDSYGIVKVKGTDKHTGVQSKWEQGALANDTSSQHDSYGIVKVKGTDKHTGVQSKWEEGSLATDTSSKHDSYGVVRQPQNLKD